MVATIDVVEIYPRTAPAIGGITGAAFTALENRMDDAETDLTGHEGRLDAYDALDLDDRLTSVAGYAPLFRADSQPAADSVSTASTSVWSTAMTLSVTVPVGVDDDWILRAVFSCLFKHSASGDADFRVVIAGNNGTTVTKTLTTSYQRFFVDHTVTGVASGLKTITLEYKSNTAGTTSADNPSFVFYGLP